MNSSPEYQPDQPQDWSNDEAGVPDVSPPQVSMAAPEAAPTHPPQPWLSEPPFPPQPEPRHPPRIPHFGHLVFLLLALAPIGLLATGLLMGLAMHDHLFGVSTAQEAVGNIRYILGSEGLLYIFTFAVALLIFPVFWHKSLLAGLQWHGETALRLRKWLLSAAVVCFLLAVLGGELFPGPTNTPIEKIFRSPGAAWLLFAFGITFAPFFEETFFRGFLLPALCTASDWIAEKVSAGSPFIAGSKGRPRWPGGAIAAAAISLGSIPAVVFIEVYVKSGRLALQILIPYLVLMALFFIIIATRENPLREHARPIDANGHPSWSIAAMIIGSVVTSIPFAAMHGEQTGYAIGPFLLLVGVSLVLCAVRLTTRSLASSVLVHACYNFLLFSLMLVASGGFRHLDKM
jgi:uncharacterized protein